MGTPSKNFEWNTLASTREMVMWAVAMVLFLGMGVKTFLLPVMEELAVVQAQVQTKKIELATLKKFLKESVADAQKIVQKMDPAKQALTQKIRDSFEHSNMAPDVVVSELFTELTKPEYVKSALLSKFNFVGEKKQPGFTEMNLDLKLIGDYEGIADYLRRLKALPYLLKVDSIQLKPYDAQAPGKLELLAKSVLYVGEAGMTPSVAEAKSDIATDLLLALSQTKTDHAPFVAQRREMAAWSVNELRLTATMAGSENSTAIINGKLFQLGDEIAEFRLVEIHPHEVLLKRGDVEYPLKISNDNPAPVADASKETKEEKKSVSEGIPAMPLEFHLPPSIPIAQEALIPEPPPDVAPPAPPPAERVSDLPETPPADTFDSIDGVDDIESVPLAQ